MAIDISVPEAPAFTPRIAVVGLGGGGCNAVDNMIEAGIEGVDFIVCNTDAQALQRSRCERKVQLGRQATRGLGAGTDPEVGRAAAEESIGEIMDAIGEANMLFVVAGMGGGTGTGAVPVVAKAAREAGILTVAVVTRPFVFEAEVRAETADAGLSELRKVVDSYIVISNQNLFKVTDEATSVVDSFRLADEVLCAGVRGVTDLIMKPGVVNVDFADVRATLKDTGPALMGTGEGEGENRVQTATSAAIHNPLLDDIPTDQAQGLLVNITAAVPTLAEVERIIDMIRERTHRRVNLIFGTAIDEGMGDRLRVSVMMTGLESDGVPSAADEREASAAPAPAPSGPVPGGGGSGPEFPFFGESAAGGGASSPDEAAPLPNGEGKPGDRYFPHGFGNGHAAEAPGAAASPDPAGGTDDAEPAPAGFDGDSSWRGADDPAEAVEPAVPLELSGDPAPGDDPAEAVEPAVPLELSGDPAPGDDPGEALEPEVRQGLSGDPASGDDPAEALEPEVRQGLSGDPAPGDDPAEALEPEVRQGLSGDPAPGDAPAGTGGLAAQEEPADGPASGDDPVEAGESMAPPPPLPHVAAAGGPAESGRPAARREPPGEPAPEKVPAGAGAHAEAGDPAAAGAQKPGFFGRLLELAKDQEPQAERREPTLARPGRAADGGRACETEAPPLLFEAGPPEMEAEPDEFLPAPPEPAEMAPGEARVTASGDPDVFQIPSFLRRR